MTPSMVAAVLGLDEEDAIRAIPYEDRPAPKSNRAMRRAGTKARRRVIEQG